MADKEHKKVIIKKVKKGGHGGHHGGSWKVAYADFVTAMMAFFLVMWLVNSVTVEKREQIAQYFQSFSLIDTGGKPGLIPATDLSQVTPDKNPPNIVEPISETPANPAQGKSEAEKAADAVKEAIEAEAPDLKEQIIVKTEADRLIIELTELKKPMFAMGKADLTPDARRALALVAPQAAKAAKGKLSIEGHTDAYTYAGERFTNWELSTERASAARRELEKSKLPPEAIGMVAGYAATKPLNPDNPYDPMNRRIRLVVEIPTPPKPEGKAAGQPAQAKGAAQKKEEKPQEPPAPPASPIPREKREILDQRIERLYDETIKGKQ